MLRNKGLALLGQKRFAAKLDGHQTAGVLKQAPLAQPPQNRVGRGFFPLQFPLAELDQLAGRDGRVGPDQLRKSELRRPQPEFLHVPSSFGLQLVNLWFEFTGCRPACQAPRRNCFSGCRMIYCS